MKRLSFTLVDMLSQSRSRPGSFRSAYASLLPLFESGALTPLPHRVLPIGRAAEGFDTMARARHTGKIVFSMKEEPAVLPAPSFGPDASVLVTGGLGGLGLAVARWLAAEGSPRLWLLGRSEG